MKINVVTPCTRPDNLKIIAESIKKSLFNYKWIIIFDGIKISQETLDSIAIPKEAEVVDRHIDTKSVLGHAQRNYALKYIEKNSWAYFNDDDTIIPENFQNVIDCYSNIDFISFPQLYKNGSMRLIGNIIESGSTDMHNFIVKSELIQDTRFIIDKRDSDGVFAKNMYQKAKTHLYTKEIVSIYNFI
jgi:hypothetical protein